MKLIKYPEFGQEKESARKLGGFALADEDEFAQKAQHFVLQPAAQGKQGRADAEGERLKGGERCEPVCQPGQFGDSSVIGGLLF